MIADLVLDALATYRLTRLVVADTFPPVKALRDRIVDRHTTRTPQDDGTIKIGPDAAAELVDCPYCASVWIAAGVLLARAVAPRAWSPLAKFLALAAVAGNLSAWLDDE